MAYHTFRTDAAAAAKRLGKEARNWLEALRKTGGDPRSFFPASARLSGAFWLFAARMLWYSARKIVNK